MKAKGSDSVRTDFREAVRGERRGKTNTNHTGHKAEVRDKERSG